MGAGQERYRSTPNKNEHSHVGDAAGYCLLGGGEHRSMTAKKNLYDNQPTKVRRTGFRCFCLVN